MIRFIVRVLPWFLLLLMGGWLVYTLGMFKNEQAETEVLHHTLVTKIESLGRLELVRYNFKDVIEYRKEVARWLPDSKTVLLVEGEAIGCLDMTKIREQDVLLQGDTLLLMLPAPELCMYKLDHSKSKVYHREYTYFRDIDLAEEAYQYAEANIKTAALKTGILEQTRTNAEKILKPMLERISGRKVILQFEGTKGLIRPRKE